MRLKMIFDKNECHLEGMVERFAVVQTKTGTPMIRFTLACNRDRFTVIAFKELAATRLNDGDRVAIIGEAQTNSWDGKDGVKRHDVQFVARSISSTVEQSTVVSLNHSAMGDKRPGLVDYQGGPF
jgi:single-stranded DNA-binding protein